MGSAAGIAAAGRRRTGEPSRKLLATVAGVLGSSSLVALSGVYSPARLLLPILGMGLSLASCWGRNPDRCSRQLSRPQPRALLLK